MVRPFCDQTLNCGSKFNILKNILTFHFGQRSFYFIVSFYPIVCFYIITFGMYVFVHMQLKTELLTSVYRTVYVGALIHLAIGANI